MADEEKIKEQTDDKMDFWNEVRGVPDSAKVPIKGGRLGNLGFVSIKTIWRIQRITELCGPRGVGWDYAPTDIRIENGNAGERVVIAIVEGWAIYKGQRLHGVDTGGSKLVASETAGLRTDDEAVKKAISDAWGSLCRTWGIGADVYWGDKSEETKYDEEVSGRNPQQTKTRPKGKDSFFGTPQPRATPTTQTAPKPTARPAPKAEAKDAFTSAGDYGERKKIVNYIEDAMCDEAGCEIVQQAKIDMGITNNWYECTMDELKAVYRILSGTSE